MVDPIVNNTGNVFSVRRMSLQQRLPLLIFILLLSIIVAFSAVSYLGVKKASLAMGRERLTTLTGQLTGMFQQSFYSLDTAVQKAATKPALKEFLVKPGVSTRAIALQTLQVLPSADNLYMLNQLYNAQKQLVLNNGKRSGINISPDSVIPRQAPGKATANVGRIFLVGDSMYYPVVAAIAGDTGTLGYLVRWRLLLSTKKGVEQLTQLLGAGGTLYFGDDDGQLWTDLVKPVARPPADIAKLVNVSEYSRHDDEPLIASVRPIPNSHWLILVEFSKTAFLRPANIFLGWVVVIGLVLITIGSIAAWLMSRNITRPIKKLTGAASAIAAGDYSSIVYLNRQDELGQLAEAFNIMAIQVRNAQYDLEKKVKDRTSELETANKELETFSYSVSHDLHAPLRIIDGYVSILTEKSATRHSAEDVRILEKIQNRTRRMRVLIDELLSLSYIGRKQLNMELQDMSAMAKSVVHEITALYDKPVDVVVQQLWPAVGDSTLLRQVWYNLIANAFKYSRNKDKPCIEISSIQKEGAIVYIVKDNGAGFEMQYATRLFGVFERLHSEHEFEGSGIGLALVQRVLHRHGGTIWAEGEVDKGATFYFSLPS